MLYLTLLSLLALLATPILSSPIAAQDVATTAASPLAKRDLNVLSIIYSMDTRLRQVNDPLYTWLFYESTYGKNAVCRPRADRKHPYPSFAYAPHDRLTTTPVPLHTIISGEVYRNEQPAWGRIGGEHYVKPYGLDCKYMNNGSNAGALWCKEQGEYKLKTGCTQDPEMHGTLTRCTDPTGDGRNQMAVAVCQWPK
jgi:hypothetical protein